jgi:hypothetical protein
MGKPRILIIAALTSAVLIAGAIPAFAASKNASVLTDDPAPGGQAIFTDVGYHYELKACDRQKDGYAAVAYASFHKWGRQNRVVDANSKGGCARTFIYVLGENLGKNVYVTVCLDRRDTPEKFCDYNVGRT